MSEHIDDPHHDLLDIKQVRRLLGNVSERTVYAWISTGKFPRGIKFAPKVVRWRRAVVEAYIERTEAQAVLA